MYVYLNRITAKVSKSYNIIIIVRKTILFISLNFPLITMLIYYNEG